MINVNLYETEFSLEEGIFQYLFESHGNEAIYKAVQYSAFTVNGETLYNFGFGDYDFQTKKVADDMNSNNGDMREVFNTVLNTVPKFFKENPGFPIYVQGSDSSDEFEKKCRLDCSKKCNTKCKNRDRRIRTYTYYVDTNFKILSQDYIFFGFDEEISDFVQYIPKNKYKAVLVYKKK